MTTVKASCPSCGDVELTPDEVLLVICNYAERSYYKFNCYVCCQDIQKPASQDIVALLRMALIPEMELYIPAEAMEDHCGPSLTYDEILDFRNALDERDKPSPKLPQRKVLSVEDLVASLNAKLANPQAVDKFIRGW